MRLAGIMVITLGLCLALSVPATAASSLGFSDIVARSRPAVVSISTRPLGQQDFAGAPTTPGLGSGVIIDSNGLILTNFHVIDGATGRIKVTLADERRFEATVVGTDAASDLALLRVAASKLPALPLGNSDRLVVGQAVIAIGNALWIEGGPTVTAGIVSALNRSMEQPGLPYLHHLIQTDAAINPGNSGGPLVNLRGEVVGINTALIPSAHGIGFAIAINGVKPVIKELLANGRMTRPWLGVDGVSVTSAIAHANDLSAERGVFVVTVDQQGPARTAGVARGDVIVALAGRTVRDLHSFEDVLGRQRIGSDVSVVVQRGSERLEYRVRVVERRAASPGQTSR